MGSTIIYGKKGKNGVVLITSKKPGSEKKIFITYRDKDSLGFKPKDKPRIYIDGKEVSESEMKELSPDKIMSIDVNKNDFQTKEMGDKGGNSVIRIYTKKNGASASSAGSGSSFSTSSTSSSDGKTTTVVVTSKDNGKSSSGSTYTVTRNVDMTKNTLGKDVVVIGYGPDKGEAQHIVIRDNTNTKDGKTVTNSTVNIVPDNVYVVIDGVPGKVSDVKSEDIESISVLKGESAKAIYGEKGANGVIMITTKTGGKPTNKEKK